MMRFLTLAACCLAGPVVAAEPIILQARTAGDLAALCAADPGIAGSDAKINFCHGFAQGAVEDRLQNAGENKPFCFPAPMPTRSATMKEYVAWVRSAPENKDLSSLGGLFKFLAARFPCKAKP